MRAMEAPRAWLTVILAAAVCAAGAAPAAALSAAALPARTAGTYGGGAVGDYLQFVSLRVQPDRRFAAHATLVTSCAPRFGDSLSESVDVRGARLAEDGRYSATTSFSDELVTGIPGIGGLHAEGTIAFSVRVLPGGVARGLVRVRTTYSDPSSGRVISRCDTGRIAWAARRPSPLAGAGGAHAGPGTERGTTSQDEPFLMRVTRRGRVVDRAGLTVRVGCPSAIGLALDVVAHGLRVRRGRFGATGRFRRSYTYPDGREVVEHYGWELRGRFGRRGARGTFELRGVVRRRSNGERVGSCESGPIAWRARP
jgi:hypothetical protein